VVTLLFGLIGLVKGTKTFVLPMQARPPLLAALGLFLLAGAMAIVTNAPLRYSGVQADDLQLAVREWWEDSAAVAQQRVAATQVRLLGEAKRLNSRKGAALVVAMAAQLLAIFFVAAAVATLLRHA
jgi:predicted Zn-dependent protease